MNKQFNPFVAVVPKTFIEIMIQHWMEDESIDESVARSNYCDTTFIKLANRIAGKECQFLPDLGYEDGSINGTLCFERQDNNVVIPVSMLEITQP